MASLEQSLGLLAGHMKKLVEQRKRAESSDY
jgi:hypothetical protein